MVSLRSLFMRISVLVGVAFLALSTSASAAGLSALRLPPDSAVHLIEVENASIKAPGYVPQFGVAFATGFVAVPFGQWLAQAVGNLSVNLIGAAIPSLLIMGFLAPTLTTLAAWAFGNWHFFGRGDRPFPFLVPWLAATGLHIAALVVGGFLGVTLFPGTLFAFAVVDSLLMSGGSVGLMQLLKRQSTARPATLSASAPGVSPTHFVPLASTGF
jgi:hypothetical protein